MKFLQRYGYFGIVRLDRDYLFTRLIYSNALLIRRPIYVRGMSSMKLGDGLTTGVNVRLDAFALRNSAPVLGTLA